MKDIHLRLIEIRKSLEGDYYWGSLTNDQPVMPIMTQAHEARLEKVLNMNLAEGRPADTKGLMKEMDSVLFRIRYRRFFAALSILFAWVEDKLDSMHRWAHERTNRYRKI